MVTRRKSTNTAENNARREDCRLWKNGVKINRYGDEGPWQKGHVSMASPKVKRCVQLYVTANAARYSVR
jgi:hypothetical protein